MSAADAILAILPAFNGTPEDGLTVAVIASATGYSRFYCADVLVRLNRNRRARSVRLRGAAFFTAGRDARWFQWYDDRPRYPPVKRIINGRQQVRRKH